MRTKRGTAVAVSAAMLVGILAGCGGSDDTDAKKDPVDQTDGGSTVPSDGSTDGGGTASAPSCPDAATVSTAIGGEVRAGTPTESADLVICPFQPVDQNTGRSANVSYFLTSAGKENHLSAKAQHEAEDGYRQVSGVGDDAIVYTGVATDEPDLLQGSALVGDVTVTVKLVPGGLGANVNGGTADQAIALLKAAVAQVG